MAQGGSGRSIIISALSADFNKSIEQRGKLEPYFELELSGTEVQTKVFTRTASLLHSRKL